MLNIKKQNIKNKNSAFIPFFLPRFLHLLFSCDIRRYRRRCVVYSGPVTGVSVQGQYLSAGTNPTYCFLSFIVYTWVSHPEIQVIFTWSVLSMHQHFFQTITWVLTVLSLLYSSRVLITQLYEKPLDEVLIRASNYHTTAWFHPKWNANVQTIS